MDGLKLNTKLQSGKVIGLSYRGQWYSRYLKQDMYKFDISIRKEDGSIIGGDWSQYRFKTKEELPFKLGDVIDYTFDFQKLTLKPII